MILTQYLEWRKIARWLQLQRQLRRALRQAQADAHRIQRIQRMQRIGR